MHERLNLDSLYGHLTYLAFMVALPFSSADLLYLVTLIGYQGEDALHDTSRLVAAQSIFSRNSVSYMVNFQSVSTAPEIAGIIVSATAEL